MISWITNIREIVTPEVHDVATGSQMDALRIFTDHGILIEDGIIREIRPDKGKTPSCDRVIDAGDRVVLPSFVDPHTHLVFGGSRENEFNMRLQGKSYVDIAQAGGGINSTVRHTREASEEQLLRAARENLTRMIAHGVTTFETKSGYGLDTETELKQLRVIGQLQKSSPVDIKATFLGAHEIPPEFKQNRDGFIDLVIHEMLPAVQKQGIAEYCDIFCETGVFSVSESRKILNAAKQLGFELRLHADELTPLGGAELAAELGAHSADHLVHISDTGIKEMIRAGTVFVMLPGTTFFLMSDHYAPAKKILDQGGILALSTDFNPGSSHTHSMPLIITLACLKMGLTIEQAIHAATINGAYSLRLHHKTGSIHPGKQADLIFMDAPSYKYLVYNFGVNRITGVMKKGNWLLPAEQAQSGH